MSLQNTLVTKLKYIEPSEVLRKIGYRNINDKTITRLENVLSDEFLGLDKSYFDFKYSNYEFVKALCKLCDVDLNDYQNELEEKKVRATTLKYAFQPYVFVDTGFRRKSQPILALAFMEGHRHLSLPIEYKAASLEEQVKYVKSLISEHYKNTDGHLEMWGKIKRYVFNFSENAHLVFSPDGELTDQKAVTQNTAKVTLGNKDITKLLNN